MDKKPLISIITISYNSCLTIEDTILSVINQTYPHIEYIVIDGGSKDGTVDIIKRYENKISYWISEPDKGIYYAMNKGIAATTGEWINFINGGDSFYDKNVIARLFKDSIGENYSVVYGNTVFQYSDHTEIEANRQYGNYKFMPACHQSIFCRTHYMKQFMFDTRYKISADFDFFYKLYFTNNQYLYKDITVAVFDAMGGISSTNKYLRNKEFICIKEKKLLKRNLLIFKLKLKYSMRNFLRFFKGLF